MLDRLISRLLSGILLVGLLFNAALVVVGCPALPRHGPLSARKACNHQGRACSIKVLC